MPAGAQIATTGHMRDLDERDAFHCNLQVDQSVPNFLIALTLLINGLVTGFNLEECLFDIFPLLRHKGDRVKLFP